MEMKRKVNKRKRGLSPVIATVLLIGIVVVIALIVFTWFKGFTQEAITKNGENAQLVCNKVKFKASLSGTTLSISNLGNEPIYGMVIKIARIGGSETKDIKEYRNFNWPEGGLNVGGAIVGDIDVSGDSVTLTPILRGYSQRGGEASYICNENQHGYKIAL